MATILKHPNESNKGILIFTHKEFYLFVGKVGRPSKRNIFNPLFYAKLLRKQVLAYYARQKIFRLRKSYLIGVHWGFFAKNVSSPSWVDFHLASENTVDFKNKPFIISMNSSSFTPAVMRPTGASKYWDIICVAKSDHKKKYPELMKSIRAIYDSGRAYKVLFVIASNLNESQSQHYNILDNYFLLFSSAERENFTIIKTDPQMGFQGFSYTFLSHLYNQSKVFTLFTQIEGAAKVIKEAQLCGLPVVAKNDLQGGGRDYLNNDNSLSFNTYEDAHLSLIEAVENYQNFKVDVNGLAKSLREDFGLVKLKEHLEVLYKKHGMTFDGILINTDNLNRRLPSHFFDKTVYWNNSPKYRFSTTDITNKKSFDRLLKGLKVF